MSYDYINLTGTIVPDTANLLAQTQQEFKDVFGQDLDVAPETPQGVLITAQTIAKDVMVRNNAALANQINPDLSGGVYLDAIWALTGGARDSETDSTVLVNMAGQPGAIIPQGVVGKNSNGDLFSSNSTIILDPDGNGVSIFTAQESGPIAAPAGTLNIIVEGSLGLETITNPADATLGTLEESDQSAKIKRKNTLGLMGRSQSENVTSYLYNTEGVLSLKYRENKTSSTLVIDGVTMFPHSIYVCVDGGTDLAVATGLNESKGGGCNYNNGPGTNVTVPVTDPYSGQVIDVKYDRPLNIPILVKVTVSLNQAVEDPETAVRDAIVAYADGPTGLTVGKPVSCFELSGAVSRAYPQLYVVNVETKLASGGSFSNAVIPIEIWEKSTLTESSITVVVV